MKKNVMHILMSAYDVDSRVKNQTESLSKDYDVSVMCLKSIIDNDSVRGSVKIIRNGLCVKSKLARFISGYISIIGKSIFTKVDLVQAHDMNALPIAYVISKLKRVPLVYDSHELWSESHHGNYSKWVVEVTKRVEVFLANRADLIFTVSDSIAMHLNSYFNCSKIKVIKNVPSYTHTGEFDIFRDKWGINIDTPIFLYQGLITEVRGARLIFDAVQSIDETKNFVFVFLGDGVYKAHLEQLILQSDMGDRVKVLGFVNQSELLKYTGSADVGVHALDRSCLNHEYCLPNKVFEYNQAGIGMICPDLVELTNFITEHKLGTVYKSGSSCDLAKSMVHYIDNPSEIVKAKNASKECRGHLNWDVEEEKLISAYRGLVK